MRYSLQVFCVFLSLWLTSGSKLLGQCPPGSVYVYNQNQVNAFLENYPDCDEINGSLIISFQSSPEITDLTPFQKIKRVNGDLQAAELNSITNLKGLENVEYVQKNLRFNMLPLVDSITELRSLKYVGEAILILNMAELLVVDSFNALTYVGKSLNITRSPKLKTVQGFEQLRSANAITFELDPELQKIPTFPSLEHIGLSIKIVDAPKLTGGLIFPKLSGSINNLTIILNTNATVKFSGFHHLDSIRNDLILILPKGTFNNGLQNLRFIGGNAEITTDNAYFDFAHQLKKIEGYLIIKDCSFLKSLGSFDDELTVDDYIALWNNSMLNICNVPFICRFKEAGNDLSIVGNLSSCSSINAIDCSYKGISGTFFYDQDQNGIRGASEQGIPNMKVEVSPLGSEFISDLQGHYFFEAEAGNSYTVTAKIPPGWQFTSDSTFAVTFAENNPQNRFHHIGVFPDFDSSAVDVLVFGSEAKCSGYASLDVHVENKGTYHETGVISLSYDRALTFAFSVPPPDSIDESNSFLMWNINALAPWEEFLVQCFFKNPGTLPNADSIHYEVKAGFETSSIDHHYFRKFVCQQSNADRKFVTPDDGSANNFISKDTELDYVVEVQNNFIDELRDVTIYDTLSPLLDMTSFKILDHSDRLNTKIEGHAITFTFDEIFLLDSALSVNQSNAFVRYSAKLVPEATMGSVIENTAYLYFDQLPLEVTNTVINTIEGVSGSDDLIHNKRFQIFPNPSKGSFTLNVEGFPANHQLLIRILNLNGQLVHRKDVNSHSGTINYKEAHLKPGMYIIIIHDLNDHTRSVSKFVIN